MKRGAGVFAAALAAFLLSCNDNTTGPDLSRLPAATSNLQSAAPTAPDCPGCIVNVQLVRARGQPVVQTLGFSADPRADYVIDVDDYASRDQVGFVWLNGALLVRPRDIARPERYHLHEAVQLRAKNLLVASIVGRLGSTLSVKIVAGAKSVGSSGGSLVVPGGAVRLDIPAGALSDTTEIRAVILSPPTATDSSVARLVTPMVSLEPTGIVFAHPVQLSLKISGSFAPGREPAVFEYVPELDQARMNEQSRYDPTTGIVSALVPHFSVWIGMTAPKPLGPGTHSVLVASPPRRARSLTSRPAMTPFEVGEEVARALQVWAVPLRRANVLFAPALRTTGDIEISFGDLGQPNPGGTLLGQTIVECALGFSQITPCVGLQRRGIIFNDNLEWYSTREWQDELDRHVAVAELLQSVGEHELGHVLGLPHLNALYCAAFSSDRSCFSPPIMAPTSGLEMPAAPWCEDLEQLARSYSVDSTGCATGIQKVSGDPTGIAAGQLVPFGQVPTVRVVDSQQRGVDGVTVVFSDVSGGIVAGGVVTTSDGGFAAAVSWALGQTAGATYTLTATAYVSGTKRMPMNWGDLRRQVSFSAVAAAAQTPTTVSVAVNNFEFVLGGGAFPPEPTAQGYYTGQGFYKGTEVLFGGGFVLGSSSSTVLVGFDPHLLLPAGFVEKTPIQVLPAGQRVADHQTRTALCPNSAQVSQGFGLPPGLAVVQESFAYAQAPDNDYVLLRYTLLNTGAGTLSGLYAGMVLDWDVFAQDQSWLDAGNQLALMFFSLTYGGNPNTPVQPTEPLAGVASISPLSSYYPYSNVPLPSEPSAPVAPSSWYSAISGGIRPDFPTPLDAVHIIAVGPLTIPAGGRVSRAFALAGGDDWADLQVHAAAARQKAAALPEFQGQVSCP